MTDEPKKMLTLAEEVAKILAAAPKPLALTAIKTGLKAVGVPTGKGGVTKAQLDAALEAEGVYKHSSKKAGGAPSYWNKPPKSAEEIAAEEAAKAAAAKVKEEEKAAKEADAARKKAEKAAKPFRELAEKVHAKVLQLGDKVVAGSGIGKPTAKTKPELHAEFERILKGLLEDKRLFEHPGGKYGRKPYEEPKPPKWYETKDAKGKIKKLLDAAKQVMAIDGATFEYVFPLIEQALGNPGKSHQTSEPSATRTETHQELPLPEFARKVIEIARNSPSDARFLGDEVYISSVYGIALTTNSVPPMTIEEFKERLLEANQKNLLQLSRVDSTDKANPERMRESTIRTPHSTYHLIGLQGV